MIQKKLDFIKKLIPNAVLRHARPVYHYCLTLTAAMIYRFPARRIKIVGVTGTKGKSTTAEMINSILEETSFKTALASTIRFKIDEEKSSNLFKMTMPGRTFLQKFIKRCADNNCDWLIMEMTSEGVKQFRHKFVYLNALVFTNISPEHIESHGSFEKYLRAKLKLAKELEKSPKQNKAIIANIDNPYGGKFLNINVKYRIGSMLENVKPYNYNEDSCIFSFRNQKIELNLGGMFNLENAIEAAEFARTQGIDINTIKSGLEKIDSIPGRLESIDEGQEFKVIIDYAHTPDSLVKLYDSFPKRKKVCVLGNAGGGRDSWKRPEMARIAEKYCDDIILTNEDPYDEDPEKIVKEMGEGMKQKKPEIIMDRREAISQALKKADRQNAVLISGKGTDPYIMGPRGSRQKWNDAKVAREEINKL